MMKFLNCQVDLELRKCRYFSVRLMPDEGCGDSN